MIRLGKMVLYESVTSGLTINSLNAQHVEPPLPDSSHTDNRKCHQLLHSLLSLPYPRFFFFPLTGIRSGEVDGLGELHEGDVIVELFGAVVSLVDVDFGDGMVFLGSILRLQVPFTDADRVGSGVFGLSEAMGGAEDVLLKSV